MLPDCIGLEVSQAEGQLLQAGIVAEIVVTRPPRGGEPVGEARVVRQRLDANGVCQLIIAYRDYKGASDVHNRQ